MKKLFISVIALAFFASCTNTPKAIENVKGVAVFGDSIKNDQVIELASLEKEMADQAKKDIKVKGIVKEVCQNKGCWMIMDLGDGKDIRVTFKDYKIFMPKDLAGKEVVLDGFAYTDTTSIETLKHYAEDAGKTQAEIEAITSPKIQLAYEAKGVVVMK